jgi:tRNA U34 5-methylaminomethyl-2-thiouridine-forming methyltransferase MnmC
LKKEIFITSDGSTSFHLPKWNEQYHSKHGALQEAYHVFVHSGLDLFTDKSAVSILEIGFGTGLNTFITFLESIKRNLKVNYVGVEKYPLSAEEVSLLNYVSKLKANEFKDIFAKIHQVNWNEKQSINEHFSFTKRLQDFKEINDIEAFNLIYFDAFGARVQPELWTEEIFTKMYQSLKPNGVLVTYSAKGSVRRAMQAVGFKVEKIPGPIGKREMLRAYKN